MGYWLQYVADIYFAGVSTDTRPHVAFVVAWAGMSSQMARLLGLLILIVELTTLLDLRKRTVWVLRGVLVVAVGMYPDISANILIMAYAVFVFASNATNTGTTRYVHPS